jgi:hypothetical protein
MQQLEQGKTYKYLGTEENEGIQHQKMKANLKKGYTRRLKLILTSELNDKNKITAIGALAIPVLRYSFCIITRKLDKINKLTRKPERY